MKERPVITEGKNKMITISLNKIRDKSPCHDGWGKVLRAHKHLGMDAEFPLTSVLNSNDLADTIWCFECLPEYNWLWRKYAVWCARQVQHSMTDERSVAALDVAWRHSDGMATDDELDAASDAAWAAARDAAWAAARDAQQKKLIEILTAGAVISVPTGEFLASAQPGPVASTFSWGEY